MLAQVRSVCRASEEAGMTEGAEPAITGIHHFSATVTDVEASAAWYQRLFGMDRMPDTFPHYERKDRLRCRAHRSMNAARACACRESRPQL